VTESFPSLDALARASLPDAKNAPPWSLKPWSSNATARSCTGSAGSYRGTNDPEEDRLALLRHGEMIRRSSKENLPEGLDRQDVEKRYQDFLEALGKGTTEQGDIYFDRRGKTLDESFRLSLMQVSVSSPSSSVLHLAH
jgi:hypothetical protein